MSFCSIVTSRSTPCLRTLARGLLDELGIDVETRRLAAVLLGRRHRDASVATAEVPEDVLVGSPWPASAGRRPRSGALAHTRRRRWGVCPARGGRSIRSRRANVELVCDRSRPAWGWDDRLDGVGVLPGGSGGDRKRRIVPVDFISCTLEKQPGILGQIDFDQDGLSIVSGLRVFASGLRERTGRDQAGKQARRQNQAAPNGNAS